MIEGAAPYFDLTNALFFPVVGELLERKIKVRFQVTGRSMAPFLQGGEIITVVKTSGRDFDPGDVLLFHDQKRILVHRLIKKKRINGRWTYDIKGDGVSCYEKSVDDENVLGKVCLVEKITKDRHYTVNLELAAWKRINRLFVLFSQGRSYLGWFFCFPWKLGLTERACQLCWCRFSK